MKTTYQHYEIILISRHQEEARWLVEVLKNSGLNNELIWLKDYQRTVDFINGTGLYDGNKLTINRKVFVINSDFEQYYSVKHMLENHEGSSNFQLVDIEEARHHFNEVRKNTSVSSLFAHKRSVIDLLTKFALV